MNQAYREADHRSDIYVRNDHRSACFTVAFGLDYLNEHMNEILAKMLERNPQARFPPALETVVRKRLQKDLHIAIRLVLRSNPV